MSTAPDLVLWEEIGRTARRKLHRIEDIRTPLYFLTERRRRPFYPQPIGVPGINSPLSTTPQKLCGARRVSKTYTLTLILRRILYLVFKVPPNRKVRRLRGNTVRSAILAGQNRSCPRNCKRRASVSFQVTEASGFGKTKWTPRPASQETCLKQNVHGRGARKVA